MNALAAFQNLPMLGVNTAADGTNRLAAKTNAVLLSHDDVTPGTGDLRVTLNKSGAGTTGGQDLYELILSAEPNGSEIKYRVERLNGGNVAESVLTTDLPVNTQFRTPHMWFNNGTTAAAVELAIVGMYAENTSLLGSRGAIG